MLFDFEPPRKTILLKTWVCILLTTALREKKRKRNNEAACRLTCHFPLAKKERKKERKFERRFGFERGIVLFTNYHKKKTFCTNMEKYGKWDERQVCHPGLPECPPGQAHRNAKDAQTQGYVQK